MKLIPAVVVCALCLLGRIDQVQSITCYSCDSVSSSDCKDPFSSSTTCSVGTQCLKTISTSSGTTYVTRSCVLIGNFGNTCDSNTINGATFTYCYCSTDKCNSAHSSRSMSHVLSLLIAGFTMIVISITSQHWCKWHHLLYRKTMAQSIE